MRYPVKIRRPQTSSRGFTLVEVLVAATIAVLMLTMLALITTQSMKVSRRTNNSNLAVNAAAAAIDMIATDLDSMAVTRQAFEYLQTSQDTVIGPTSITVTAARLMLNSLPPMDANSSADQHQARAICYRLLYQDPVSSSGAYPIYGLYRQVQSTTETFQNVLGQTDLSTYWSSKTPALDDFLVGQVVDFQISFFNSNAATSTTPINVSGSTYQPVRLAGTGATVNGAAYAPAPPATIVWAEVSITVLQEAGATLLGKGTMTLAETKLKYGQTLTRRVALRTPY